MDFKVRCIDDVGKSNIIGGIMTFDDGTKSTSTVVEYPLFENVRQINRHLRSQFESVEENMRKEVLKTGMMLCTRNSSYINLDCYNDDLTDKNDRKWDITKVGSALYPMSFSEQRKKIQSNAKHRKWRFWNKPIIKTLWERKEPLIEVTLEEIAKLKGVSVDRIRIKE